MHAFHSLKNVLFEKDVIENVVTIKIPQDRAFMHIDTVFTQIHENHIVAFQPIVKGGQSGYVEVHSKDRDVRKYATIQEFILEEVNPHMEFIPAGGGESPYQEREQWTDACNLLALKPGVALSYDRNVRTAKALSDIGYRILSARDFLALCANDPTFADTLENTIITLPSAELSRARGGAHCMSCPILREG
jgi:arginine deiminase